MRTHIHIRRVARHANRPGLALVGLFVLGLVQAAYSADDASIYTTVDEQAVTTTTSDDGAGNTSTNTITTSTSREEVLPGSAENRNNAWQNDPNAANFPYDSTGGAHRNDLDTARKGFDDPRNPWDGRYSNDNPANYPVGSGYDRGESIRDYSVERYRPGAFGTNGVSERRGGRGRD